MYRVPSRRRVKKTFPRLNLIPILDAVFIFIFFLLMSANFIKIFEIPSEVPIISSTAPPKTRRKPLALAINIDKKGIHLYRGVPSRLVRRFPKLGNGEHNVEGLHNRLIVFKKSFTKEKTIVFEPTDDVSYIDLVAIMDAVRTMRPTDEAIWIRKKGEDFDTKIKELFTNIIFGNIQG
ncbi:MAG: biopolymer transporter ExbD [Halobacteriovoraceae bacterium]|jgi:biopolymer transport protein ExbD|nr:biopolymer transporter ExbD [Halobacteriovoraceae bacterium]MBT5094444.1 biopolymer transporter ExbD [Halobacteriovoraceae bacterium]